MKVLTLEKCICNSATSCSLPKFPHQCVLKYKGIKIFT